MFSIGRHSGMKDGERKGQSPLPNTAQKSGVLILYDTLQLSLSFNSENKKEYLPAYSTYSVFLFYQNLQFKILVFFL